MLFILIRVFIRILQVVDAATRGRVRVRLMFVLLLKGMQSSIGVCCSCDECSYSSA